MNIEEARALCRDYAERGMRKLHTEDALERAGCDKEMIEEVIADFSDYRNAHLARRRRVVQLGGAAVFFRIRCRIPLLCVFPLRQLLAGRLRTSGDRDVGAVQDVPAVMAEWLIISAC